jgi:hypothetical protein
VEPAVIAFVGVLIAVGLLALVLMPLWARRRMSAHVSRYLRLRPLAHDTTPITGRPPAHADDHDDYEHLPERYWTALDDRQLTRLLRDSSP